MLKGHKEKIICGKIIGAAIIFLTFSISEAFSCACGCGVLNVGTSSLIPNCEGGIAFLQYDYLNQSRNWQGNSKSDANLNEDKQIKSRVVTAGMQYMFNRNWGAAIRVPYFNRQVKMTEIDDDGNEIAHSNKVNSIGDIRINGIYSGFFADMSTGITFGLKLPTGQSNAKSFDSRDLQIGTGSTDWLLGAYHFTKIDNAGKLNWFVQGNWQHAFIVHNGYRPGDEVSAATGISYNAGSIFGIKKIAPILQITGSRKTHDSNWAADQENSGYTHAYFAPAIELTFGKIRTYADIEFPFYQKTNGNQLVPSVIYKVILGYNF
ncbi:MAG: hypothetical protein SFV53_01705 [Rickettsiales bacterium]|nr:hypothetical protein [Rickettsiales bacterium]